VKNYIGNAPPINDDLPRIEFSAPHNLVKPVSLLWQENMDEMLQSRVSAVPFVAKTDDSTVKKINRFRDASSYIMKTGILNAQCRFFEALTTADSALALMPGDTTAAMARREAADNALRLCLNNARGLRKQGLLQGAEYGYLQALAVDSLCTPVHTELTSLYISLGMMEKGLEHARKAVMSSPDDPAVRTNLAVVYMNLNRQADAESELLRAIGSNAAYGRAHYFLGMLYEETGRKEQARDAMKHAEELRYSPPRQR
jgi:tetratricopeptide (TPR) repeat protein